MSHGNGSEASGLVDSEGPGGASSSSPSAGASIWVPSSVSESVGDSTAVADPASRSPVAVSSATVGLGTSTTGLEVLVEDGDAGSSVPAALMGVLAGLWPS